MAMTPALAPLTVTVADANNPSGSTLDCGSGLTHFADFAVSSKISIQAPSTSTNSNTSLYTVVATRSSGRYLDVSEVLTAETVAGAVVISDTTALYSADRIADNISSGLSTPLTSNVFLEFSARNRGDIENSQGPATNRIMLKCDSVGISVSKSVPVFSVPGSSFLTGETSTISMDLASSTKSFSISGIITEQYISKQYPASADIIATGDPGYSGAPFSRLMTAFEVAQLIQASVDSSPRQPHQHLNRLGFLIPSRVGYNYDYHNTDSETNDISVLPLIPYSFKSRKHDALSSAQIEGEDYFTPISNAAQISHPIVIKSFNCNFAPGQPYVGFDMQGEFIFDILGAAIDLFKGESSS